MSFSVPTKEPAAGMLKEAEEEMLDTFVKSVSSGSEILDMSRNPEERKCCDTFRLTQNFSFKKETCYTQTEIYSILYTIAHGLVFNSQTCLELFGLFKCPLSFERE